jgi:hypothetical protein
LEKKLKILKSKLYYKLFYSVTFLLLFVIGVILIYYYNSTDYSTYSKVLTGFIFLLFTLLILVIYLSIKDEKYIYLSLRNYNNVHRNNDYWGIGFFGISGFFLMFLGIKGI